MNNNDNSDTINAPMDESEEVVVEELSKKSLKSEESDNHQDITRRTNSGAGVEILDPSFTKNSYGTTNKRKQLFMPQDKIR